MLARPESGLDRVRRGFGAWYATTTLGLTWDYVDAARGGKSLPDTFCERWIAVTGRLFMKPHVSIIRVGLVVVSMGLGLLAPGMARQADAGPASPTAPAGRRAR